jgi:hypothetical protein
MPSIFREKDEFWVSSQYFGEIVVEGGFDPERAQGVTAAG